MFGSKTRVKLLRLFYGNPNRSFYVREITRKIDEQINSVRRELANLLSIGIISSETNNNRLYYEVNQTYPYFDALTVIFGGDTAEVAVSGEVTAAADNDLKTLKALGNVELAFYTGQFTRDDSAEVDLLIVGDVNQAKLGNFIAELEAKEGKDIRYTVLPTGEFRYRQQVKDRFLTNLMDAKKQVLIDKQKFFSNKDKED